MASAEAEVEASEALLRSTLATYGVRADTDVGLPGELASSWTDRLPSTPELRAYFACNGDDLVVKFAPEDLTLYGCRNLAEGQNGYAGPGFDASWLVIGDSSSDPVFAETSEEGTPISIAIHGGGAWKPMRLAPSLTDFLSALTEWVAVLYGQFAGDALDEQNDFAFKDGFLEATRSALGRRLPQEVVTNWLGYITT